MYTVWLQCIVDLVQVVDTLADELTARARKQGVDGTDFIEYREVFGGLVDDQRFVDAYKNALRLLHEKGARATVDSIMKSRYLLLGLPLGLPLGLLLGLPCSCNSPQILGFRV